MTFIKLGLAKTYERGERVELTDGQSEIDWRNGGFGIMLPVADCEVEKFWKMMNRTFFIFLRVRSNDKRW